MEYEKTEEEPSAIIVLDSSDEEWEFEDTKDAIKDAINDALSTFEIDRFFIQGSNLGWRHQSASDIKQIEVFSDLRECFPNTEVYLRAKFYKDRIKVSCSHHDAQNEFYLFEMLTSKKITELYKEGKMPLYWLLEHHNEMSSDDKISILKEVIVKDDYESAYDLISLGFEVADQDHLIKAIPHLRENNAYKVLHSLIDNYDCVGEEFLKAAEEGVPLLL